MEIGFTQQEYSIDEIDGQVLICNELLNPVHLSSPIEMRVETEDQTALGIFMIMHNKDYSFAICTCTLDNLILSFTLRMNDIRLSKVQVHIAK